MSLFLGWVLLAAAAVLLLRVLRGTAGRRRSAGAAVACALLGTYLVAAPRLALARLRPVDLSHPDDWVIGGPPGAVRWEDGRLHARLVVESESYAAIPVDWRGGAFRTEWDMTVRRLDLRPEWGERASVAVGVVDGSAASIDDPDHVGGAAVQATFSDDVRLRASNAEKLLKTHSSAELSQDPDSPRPFTPAPPVRLRLNVPYQCVLTYHGPSGTAALVVTQGGQVVARRRLEDLDAYDHRVAWFAVTVRGFKRRNRAVEARLGQAYTKPEADVVIENIRFAQP